MTEKLDLPNIRINGPFWSAEATLLQLENPVQNWTFRNLFLDATPRNLLDQKLLLPGTMLVLCAVSKVQINPTADDSVTYTWEQNPPPDPPVLNSVTDIEQALVAGQVTLLLVSSPAEEWSAAGDKLSFPPLTCLAGEIGLDGLTPGDLSLYPALGLTAPDATRLNALKNRTGAAYLPGALTVHASGFSLYGLGEFLWDKGNQFAAPFLVSRIFPDPAISAESAAKRGFRLTIETERLLDSERTAIIQSWKKLSIALNPQNPRSGLNTLTSPDWVTLEVANPLAIPRLYWEVAPWKASLEAALPIHFGGDEITLLLSDQSPYSKTNPTATLAQSGLSDITLSLVEGGKLAVAIRAGKADSTAKTRLNYAADYTNSRWSEKFSLNTATLAFDPVETPRFLRNQQGLRTPEWLPDQKIEPPTLWGFMPLADGWAQLPVPNLTEQIYLDSQLAQLSGTTPTALLQGAVSYGNDQQTVIANHPNEQPWSFTLTNAGQISGQWLLDPAAKLQISAVSLEIDAPDIILNGIFWLSTGQPTVEDALPGLDDWVAGLKEMPLKTVKADSDLFPAPVVLAFDALSFGRRNPDPAKEAPSAELGDWSFLYQVDEAVFNKVSKVLPADTFSRFLPYLWRRHRYLPMVQALPLTQSQTPPNYPSPSRQLIPFELSLAEANKLPVNWAFSSSSGATGWPDFKGSANPAKEWLNLPDLPLVALSLPGLVLDPTLLKPVATEGELKLPLQYRFDLPYTDELNALAQLPKVPRDPNQSSPLPDAPKPIPPKPLLRQDYEQHWFRLSEQASLASPDATEALTQPDGQATLTNLVEPLQWPVKPTFELEAYPGKFRVANSDGGAALDLEGEPALKGISGRFGTDGTGKLQRLANDAKLDVAPYELEAGSMLAYRTKSGEYRDQRGLFRQASQKASNFIKTSVHLEEGPVYELTSTLAALDLNLGTQTAWKIWFKDLPVQAGSFARANVLSSAASDTDINDPEARSREFNYLNGYEWRLNSGQADQPGIFSLYGLSFYPLTLEKVGFAGNQVSSIELIGRLQLPLPNDKEQPELSNATRLIFSADSTGKLSLSGVSADSATIKEWPLALQDEETSFDPRLEWSEIKLAADSSSINVIQPRLKFFLFEVEWTVILADISFQATAKPIDLIYYASSTLPNEPVTPKKLHLQLNPSSGEYELTLGIDIRLSKDMVVSGAGTPPKISWQPTAPVSTGTSDRATFQASALFNILKSGQTGTVEWDTDEVGNLLGHLFGDLALDVSASTLYYTRNALQFAWQNYQSAKQIQVLPGMYLARSAEQKFEPIPGFATVSFEVLPAVNSVPQLRLQSGYVETLLHCQWEKSLQAENGGVISSSLAQIFGSSAGDITFGYTGQWLGTVWNDALLLNGYLEVKNLVSWPKAISYDKASGRLTLPPARDTFQPPPLNHIRHTLRVLFNQHVLSTGLLEVSQSQTLIFNLAEGQSWQFLAVVEHQLADILPDASFQNFRVTNDRRWTTVQEVRLLLPSSLAQFLKAQQTDELQTVDPAKGIASIAETNSGYLGTELRARLTEGEQAELARLPVGTLMVEASAVHWLAYSPVAAIANQPSNGVARNGVAPVPDVPATTLQFLPNGSQMAILSNPSDFQPADRRSPWHLLTIPFLGRLQAQENDGLTAQGDDLAKLAGLQVDPVLRLYRLGVKRPLPDLFLSFSHWGDASPVEISVSSFDDIIGRSWPRLDPLSLEESWFRLQNPLAEPVANQIQSVMAALPQTPARLSRSVALTRAFTASSQTYPPSQYTGDPPPEVSGDQLSWRQNNLLVLPGISDLSSDSDAPYGWYFTAVQIAGGGLQPENQAYTLRRYPAATALPTLPQPETNLPLSLAVSPYLGLDFKVIGAGATRKQRLSFAELLCLDKATGQLRPVASFVWEVKSDQSEVSETQKLSWARESHRRLSPDSPVAVVRSRDINENTVSDGESMLTTSYSFLIVSDLQFAEPLAKRVFRLRADLLQLHFTEGHFAGSLLPDAQTLKDFEIAPPQTVGVQPLYFNVNERPKAETTESWPWGLSTLRVSIKYTDKQAGVIGGQWNGTKPKLTLWWQAPQHSVQFRAAKTGKASAGLPPLFRARAIKSLLPVLPNPPQPPVTLSDFAASGTDHPYAWQPVLPGALRYLLLGARPGAMLALRHQLLRQSNLDTANSAQTQTGDMLVSGSVPVQHRVPRPVALPENAEVDSALQTWASYFNPQDNQFSGPTPVDTAFMIMPPSGSAKNVPELPFGLKMELQQPKKGAIPANWDGTLTFKLSFQNASAHFEDWTFALELVNNTGSVRYTAPKFDKTSSTLTAVPNLADSNQLQAFKASIASLRPGATVLARARVKPASSSGAFFQTLTFPLRVAARDSLPLPLAPYFIHFEDPEYNRRLASAAAHASGTAKIQGAGAKEVIQKGVMLSTDRREYNANSVVALRYDWDDNYSSKTTTADIKLQRLDVNGVVTNLRFGSIGEDGSISAVPSDKLSVMAGAMQQIPLLSLQDFGGKTIQLNPGETLQVQLSLAETSRSPKITAAPVDIFLQLRIVEAPVIPVPQAAYALLRSQTVGGKLQVECVRFAWSPNASRVELINPNDLRTEVVRRRAVFQWSDSARPGTIPNSTIYQLQKITQTGSTHFPDMQGVK